MTMIKKFKFENEDHTLGALVRKEILKKDVDFAAYKKTHSLVRNVELTVAATNPEIIIEDSIKDIQKDIKKLRKGWEKISCQ